MCLRYIEVAVGSVLGKSGRLHVRRAAVDAHKWGVQTAVAAESGVSGSQSGELGIDRP